MNEKQSTEIVPIKLCLNNIWNNSEGDFSIKKYPVTVGDPLSIAWCTTGHGLLYPPHRYTLRKLGLF